MRAVFGPVGAVGDDRAAADDRLHVGRELGKPRHRRIDAGRRAHARQAAQLRADQERIDAAGVGRELRVVQHHAPVAPAVGIADAEERIDLRRRRARCRRASRLPRRRIAGDAAAPGIGRLRRRAGPGIGQRVAGRHVHHQERIERDLEAARLQLGDQLRHARVGRRAAIGRPAVDLRDQVRARAVEAGDRPGRTECGLDLRSRRRAAPRNDRRADRRRTRRPPARRVRGSGTAPAIRRARPSTSEAACATWRFSGANCPGPTTCTTVDGS